MKLVYAPEFVARVRATYGRYTMPPKVIAVLASGGELVSHHDDSALGRALSDESGSYLFSPEWVLEWIDKGQIKELRKEAAAKVERRQAFSAIYDEWLEIFNSASCSADGDLTEQGAA